MKLIRSLLTLCALALVLVSPADASRTKGETITYADYGFINYIATSLRYVYFATTSGVIVYNKIEQRWETPITGADGIDTENISRIWVDRFDQQVYAQTTLGLYAYDSLWGRWTKELSRPAMESDDRHVATPQAMIPPFKYNYGSDGSLIDPYGRSYSISDIVDDGSGTLWFGTWGHGPARSSNGANTLELLPFGLIQNPAYTLRADGNNLWVAGPALGSNPTGITIFNRDENSFAYIETGTPDLPTVDINCLDIDANYVYFGTPYGMVMLDKGSHLSRLTIDKRHGLSDQNVTSVRVVGDSVFIGTVSGLVAYKRGHEQIQFIGQQEFFNRVIYDMEEVNGYLWIGTSAGAYRLNLKSGRLQKFQDPEAVLFNRVFDIFQNGDDLWLASDAGILRVNLVTGNRQPIRLSSQKSDSRAIVANDKIAAVASDYGVSLIFLSDDEEPYIKEFGVSDGLASQYVYSLELDGDYLWIGTDRGLTRFWWANPRRID